MYKLYHKEIRGDIQQSLAYCKAHHIVLPQYRIDKANALPPVKGKVSLGASILLAEVLRDYGFVWDDICYTHQGKPYLSGDSHYISLSHSSNRVLVGIADSPIGVDIEKLRLPSEKLIRRVCNEREVDYILSHNAQEQGEAFTSLWCLKEAIVKLLGIGIAVDLRRYSFEVSPCGINGEDLASGYQYSLGQDIAGYRYAVALEK